MNEELNFGELENIVGGVNGNVAEDIALNNSNNFRKEQIERLKEEREKLVNMSNNQELSMEELDKVIAGIHR